ncbi:MAG: hypothetical protein ACXABC_12670 [Candidatus Thorarchaeota archaeon]|jgi:hypothetical protein
MRRAAIVFLLVVMLLAVPLGAPPGAQRTEGPFGGTILSMNMLWDFMLYFLRSIPSYVWIFSLVITLMMIQRGKENEE